MYYITVLRHILKRTSLNKQTTRVISFGDVNDTTNLKPWSQIPGPKSYPFVGSLPNFLPGGELYNLSLGDAISVLNNRYGPIVRLEKLLDKKPTIFLFDAESIAQVHHGENQTPIRPTLDSLKYFRTVAKNLPQDTPTGLLTENGRSWQEFRSTVNPILMQPKIMKFYTTSISEISSVMVERLKALRDGQDMVSNLERQIYLWSLECLGVIALGCRLNCFNDDIDKDSPERQLVDVVEHIMRAFHELDMLQPSIWKYYPTKTFRKARADYKKQEILASHFIEKAIIEFKSNPKSNDQKGVLEKLLDINKDVALIMVTDMLLAGLDTVTHTALGILYLLASNPDKQFKLRAELKTNDEKKPYLKACFKEAMRMMPVVSATARLTTKEYNILGYEIPKDVFICLANRDIARMDKYFLRPLEYIPERWLVDRDDPLCYKNGHPFAYNPFGFGSRICIGRRIAELEIEALVEHVVRNLDVQWFGPPPKIENSSINYVKGPYNFIFKDAN